MMMNYRADIDGLRALAILFVLVYHGKLSLFPSGFIGVDIFFVISGFLISTIVYQSLQKGTFSFSEFYKKRLWRLQPVLVVFFFISMIFALTFFLPEDLIQYFKSAKKVSLFEANTYFKKHTTGYFAPDSFQLPLLHTWSLAIEWQCYLLLPLLVFSCQKIFKNLSHWVIYILCILSYLIAHHYSQTYPAQTYYLFGSRLFEFFIGAAIALTPLPQKLKNSTLITFLVVIALCLLGWIAHQKDILLGYPNGYTLVVCLSTASIIIAGTLSPSNRFRKILEIKPLVFIGLISYSLYIWHWLIFAILRYHQIPETNFILLYTYLFIFLFSYGSWKFIEKPARALSSQSIVKSLFLLVIAPIFSIHLIASLVTHYQGFPQRFDKELVEVYKRLNEFSSARRGQCVDTATKPLRDKCWVGATENPKLNALMIGDSFSNHYWGFMDVLGKNANVQILAQATSSCLTLPGIYLFDWWHFKNKNYEDCYSETKKYYQLIEHKHFNYVILGQMWSNYYSNNVINSLGDKRSLNLSKQRIEVALDQALKSIISSGAKPLLIKASASMQENFHDCFFKHIKLGTSYNPDECNFKLINTEAEQWFSQLFDKMKKKYPQIVLIDPKKVQCKNQTCRAAIHGIPMYRDVGHLTDYASYQLGDLYLKRFENPFLQLVS